MTQHALLSPSGAHRWMHCPGSLVLESKIEDVSSTYADEGTAAHTVGSWMLANDIDRTPGQPLTPSGVKATFPDDPLVQTYVNAAMLSYLMDYCKVVRQYAGDSPLLVEQRIDFSKFIGVPKSFGKGDVIIIGRTRLVVIDLKYGMGVKVDAFENEQELLYGLGALETFDYLIGDEIEEIVLVISQPRLDSVSEYIVTVENMKAFAETARVAAVEALAQFELPEDEIKLAPSEKPCQFCRAKATCPALRNEVMSTITAAAATDFDAVSPPWVQILKDVLEVAESHIRSEFEGTSMFAGMMADLEPARVAIKSAAASDFDMIEDIAVPGENALLASAMDKVGLIEGWCAAVRAETERKLIAGDEVPGFKLVEGRRGNRAWVNAEDVEAQLLKWRLKHEVIYDFSLKSPTQAEKVLPPNRWKALQSSIDRKAGKPSVAPVTDPRPAISLVATAAEFGE